MKTSTSGPASALKLLKANGALVAMNALLAFNVIKFGHQFYGPDTVRNLLSQNAAVGMLAVGMTLVIIGGGIDLSVGSMLGLVASVGLIALNKAGSEDKGTMVAIVVCLGSGALLGLLNGLIITVGRIAPFIATLAGLVAFRSIALVLGDGGEIRSASDNVFPALAARGIPVPGIHLDNGKPFEIQWPVIIFLVIAGFATWLLNRSRFGRRLIAVGANEQAAVYSGIDVAKIKWASYSMLGLCVGCAALCQSSRMNSVTTSQLGLYRELDAIAAVAIGGASMSGGRGRIWSSIVGVVILGVIEYMLVALDVSVYWQGCVKAAIILLAVLVQRGSTAKSN